MVATTLALIMFGIGIGGAALVISKVWWFPELASNWSSIDDTLVITTIVTGIVFVVLHLIMGVSIMKFSTRDGLVAKNWHENHKLEKTLIIIVSIGCVILLGPALGIYANYLDAPEDAMEVDVLGWQWAWGYRLPGEDGVLGRTNPKLFSNSNFFGVDPDDPASHDDQLVFGPLFLPKDRPAKFSMRAKDVIHSFYIPEFRIKMDAVPGIITESWATPIKTGNFQVLCTELCGVSHYLMRSTVMVVEQDAWDGWAQNQMTVAKMMNLSEPEPEPTEKDETADESDGEVAEATESADVESTDSEQE